MLFLESQQLFHNTKKKKKKKNIKMVSPQNLEWILSNDTQIWLQHISGLENEENTILRYVLSSHLNLLRELFCRPREIEKSRHMMEKKCLYLIVSQ